MSKISHRWEREDPGLEIRLSEPKGTLKVLYPVSSFYKWDN